MATAKTQAVLSGIALTVGAVLGYGTKGLTNGAHEVIRVVDDDSIRWQFSILSDSTLRRTGPNTFKCTKWPADSRTFARAYVGNSTVAVSGDTIDVQCRSSADSAVKTIDIYTGFRRDSLGNPVGVVDTLHNDGSTICLYVVGRNAKGRPITGRKFTLSSSDSTIVKVMDWSACPDTTIDPETFLQQKIGTQASIWRGITAFLAASQ